MQDKYFELIVIFFRFYFLFASGAYLAQIILIIFAFKSGKVKAIEYNAFRITWQGALYILSMYVAIKYH